MTTTVLTVGIIVIALLGVIQLLKGAVLLGGSFRADAREVLEDSPERSQMYGINSIVIGLVCIIGAFIALMLIHG